MIMYTANVKQINWIDKEAAEAELLCEINGTQYWAFCHPCNFREGETTEAVFNFIDEEISEFAFWNENRDSRKEIVPAENDRWRYYCYGQLQGINPTLVDCGTITLSVGDFVNDERAIGKHVYFVISRLDIAKI
jgi:hypothetical protein